MKERWGLASVAFVTFLSVLCAGTAAAQTLGPVRNLTSSHGVDVPSRKNRITMEWDHSQGEPYVYFVVFDTNPERTLEYPEVAHIPYVRSTNITWDAPEESDDDAYYFHVAAGDTDWGISTTTTAGPYRIDVVPPYDVSVTAPEITSTRTVTLTLTSTNACMARISESEDDLSRQNRSDPEIMTNWEFIEGFGEYGYDILVSAEECEQSGCKGVRTSTREWELSEGGGEKTVYVRFYDLVLKTADASVVITFVSGDIDGNLSVELGDAVLAMQVLAGAETRAVNPDADVNRDGKIGTEEVMYILKSISDNPDK